MSFKFFLAITFLTLSIISTFLLDYIYISLSISIFTFFTSFIFRKKYFRIFIATLIISFFTIFTNSIIIFKFNQDSHDPYFDSNVLLGTWIFNDYGGSYIFNDDFSFIRYNTDNADDNYCKGTYNYTYGGISKNKEVIKEDEHFYYYNLDLDIDFCYNDGYYFKNDNVQQLIFALGKNNDTFLLIDKTEEIMFYLKK